jgi:hypothetical protein
LNITGGTGYYWNIDTASTMTIVRGNVYVDATSGIALSSSYPTSAGNSGTLWVLPTVTSMFINGTLSLGVATQAPFSLYLNTSITVATLITSTATGSITLSTDATMTITKQIQLSGVQLIGCGTVSPCGMILADGATVIPQLVNFVNGFQIFIPSSATCIWNSGYGTITSTIPSFRK